MNISSLFSSTFKGPLLFNVEGENITQSWTNKELYSEIAQISQSLVRYGISKGDKILILTGNSAETLAFILATFNIGAIAVPVNPYIGHEVLLNIVRSMSPKACFFERTLNLDIYEALSPICQLLISFNEGSVKNKFGESIKNVTYNELCMGEESHSILFGGFEGKHLALIIHTSGSEGQPKVIQLSHQSLFNFFHYQDLVHRQFSGNINIGGIQKPFLSVFHPSHLASIGNALQGLLMHRPTYLLNGFLPRTYLKLLSKLDCHLLLLVPSMYVNLLQEEELIAESDFSSIELCCAIGEPCSEALAARIEQAFGATLFSGYGLTECLPGIAHSLEDLNQKAIAKGSSGKLLFEEVKLVDKEGISGNHGELWIRNPTVHYCYSDESLNYEKINEEGWFKTGDLFSKDKEGNFFHKGRIDDMFVCNGKNIYPAEIESVLLKHPSVENVVACGVTGAQGKTIPATLIQSQVDLSEKELMAFFLKNGPMHAIPKVFKIVAALPELGPGKKDRKACEILLQEKLNS